MSFIAVAAGVSAGAGVYSAVSASKANKAGLAAENDRISALNADLEIGRQNAAALRANRDVPSELFADMLRQFPDLLNSILPQLIGPSIDTTNQLAQAGLDQFLDLRDQLNPGARQLEVDRLDQINQLNPENLGQEEILAITRKLSPLIPQGTLDPTTGAVSGATTNPVSLYRNLISSKFGERRSEFLNQSRQFGQDANNAAARQQVSAADFLNSNLDRAFNTSAALASADIQQQQLDINAQEAHLLAASQGLQSQFDPSGNNAIIASGTQTAISSLGTAANALSSRKK